MKIFPWKDIRIVPAGLKKKIEKGDEEVSKKKAQFTTSDGVVPTFRDGAYDLRSPVMLNVEAGGAAKIGLGVKCDVPLLVFRSGTEEVCSVFDSGEEITITIKNAGSEMLLLERGDRIARAIPLV